MLSSFHGFYGRMMSQLRLGLSNLRGDMFSFHLNDNPFCPICLNFFESAIHFFCDCVILLQPRNVFMANLSMFVPNLHLMRPNDLVKLCWFGSIDYSYDINIVILKLSIDFIMSSDSFSTKFMKTLNWIVFCFQLKTEVYINQLFYLNFLHIIYVWAVLALWVARVTCGPRAVQACLNKDVY